MNVLLIAADGGSDIARDLARLGVQVTAVDQVSAGIAAIDPEVVDAVVVSEPGDLELGLEVLDHVMSAADRVPVFLISGSGSRDLDDAAYTAGATGFLAADEVSGVLLERLIRYATRKRKAPERMARVGGKEITLQVALARGMTVREAARVAGVSERTAYRRIKDPRFRSQMSALETELRERIVSSASRDG